jgi:amino acid transporter
MDEKYTKNGFSTGPDSPSGSAGYPSHYGDDSHRSGIMNRVVDSFKRDPHAHATPKGAVGADGKVFDVESAAAATAESPLARKLKGRHLQMIAIGGSIGTLRTEGLYSIGIASLTT